MILTSKLGMSGWRLSHHYHHALMICDQTPYDYDYELLIKTMRLFETPHERENTFCQNKKLHALKCNSYHIRCALIVLLLQHRWGVWPIYRMRCNNLPPFGGYNMLEWLKYYFKYSNMYQQVIYTSFWLQEGLLCFKYYRSIYHMLWVGCITLRLYVYGR